MSSSLTESPRTQLKSTGLSNPCYEFRVIRDMREAVGELTYNLNDQIPNRRLLRLREADARRLFKDLPSNRQFEQFCNQVSDMKSRGIGNISIAKGMVLEQYDSSQPNPEHGIAVHHMGPVPVFLLPESVTGELAPVDVNGATIKPVIGVYPSLSNGESRTVYKQDLLRSYNIQLDIMLQKYLEDVGEHFHDIENYLSRPEVLRRAKQAEAVLQQSIADKVDLIIRHAGTRIDPDLYPLARKTWATYSQAIIKAGLARVFALFLLNELYRILGIADKSAKYEQDWDKYSDQFIELSSKKEFEESFDPGSELYLLRHARSHYLGGSADSEFDILQAEAKARGIRWVQDFINFIRFVASLRREGVSIGTGRLFISLQHNVDAATNFFQSITNYIDKQLTPTGRPLVQILGVDNHSVGAEFERLIKLRIWLSDLLLAVIPTDFEISATDEPKDLEWVVREVDYAILLHRLLRLFLQDGVSREKVVEVFERDIELLAPTNHRYSHDDRKDRRVSRLVDVMTNSFTYQAEPRLSENVKVQIDQLMAEARERHAREVVTGFLKQFDHQEMILKILRLTNFARSRNWVCDQIADEHRAALLQKRMSAGLNMQSKRALRTQIDKEVAEYRKRVVARFDLVRKSIANRGLMIDAKKWLLLEAAGPSAKRTYKSNLRGILKALLPECNDQQLVIMHERVFKLLESATSGRKVA